MGMAPRWFTIVAIVALLWNLLGCFAFASDLRVAAEDMARMAPAQQALYHARPPWAVAATALAVFGGVQGCIGLLRRRWRCSCSSTHRAGGTGCTRAAGTRARDRPDRARAHGVRARLACLTAVRAIGASDPDGDTPVHPPACACLLASCLQRLDASCQRCTGETNSDDGSAVVFV